MQVKTERGGPPGEAGAARKPGAEDVTALFSSMVLALRALQLYGPTNLTTQRAVDHLRACFERAWAHGPELEVELRANTILYGEQVVYQNTNQNENLAFLMFRDGLRTLHFQRGFERDELPAFLDVLQRVRYQPCESDDLITLLWDEDFLQLKHGYIDADTSAEEAAEVEAEVQTAVAAASPGSLVMRIHDASVPAALSREGYDTRAYPGSADPPALPAIQATLQPNTLQLDPEALVYLQRELEEEMRRDLRQDVVNALLDCLEEPDPKAQSEILGIFSDLVPQLVAGRHLRLVAETVGELRALQEQPDVLDEVRRREVEVLFEDLALSKALQDFLGALESGDLRSELESVQLLVSSLGPGVLPRLLRAREKVGGKELRAALESAVEGIAKRHPEAVVRALKSEDALVVRAALRILVGLRLDAALPESSRLLRHPETRVRLGAVEVLVALGSKEGLGALAGALNDAAREVRVAALWGLATWRHEPVIARLEQGLESKTFRDADSDEKMALLDAYARIAGAAAVERLGRLLRARVLLKPKEPADVRACAARALGLTGSPEAKAVLERAQDDRDPEVRRAVQRSLRKFGAAS